MPGEGGESKQSGRLFATTQWSLVLAAADSERPGSRQALAVLCEAYWYPVYVLIRQIHGDPEQARDLTQGFFVELLDRGMLEVADPNRGRFRSFLRTAVRHHVSRAHREATALKRGGGRSPLSLDFEDAEARWRREPSDTTTPEVLFEKRWAHVLLNRALSRLRTDMDGAARQTERYRRFLPFLTDQSPRESYRDAAAALGMTEAAVKKAIQRLRLRFGDLLREEVSQTVQEPEEIDDEIRHLFTVLGTPQ